MTGEVVFNPDGEAFLADFRAVSTIGETGRGGVDRQAATRADGELRRWLSSWLAIHGFRVEVDAIGNLFGVLEWTSGAPVVLSGSHLDSQPWGGKFDGAYGVVASAHAALRVARRVSESGESPPFNIAVVDWFNEEGSRFTPSMMGSSVFTGKLALETALATTDAGGTTVEEALDEIGSRGDGRVPAVRSYAEIHVEQGRVLEDEGTTIGLVTSTWAARKFDVVVDGEQSHTGSTTMADRRDALVGAARLVVAVRALAEAHTESPLHTSVARFEVEPNSPVVVARRVLMNVDLRAPDPAVLDAAEAELRAVIAEVEQEAHVTVSLRQTHGWDRQPYPASGITLAQDAATAAGLSSREIMTIAGHDSTNLKDVVPTVMLFIPSVEGIAHNERELSRDEDCVAGVDLLTEVLERLCWGAEI